MELQTENMDVFWTNTDLNTKWRGARAPKLSVSLRVDLRSCSCTALRSCSCTAGRGSSQSGDRGYFPYHSKCYPGPRHKNGRRYVLLGGRCGFEPCPNRT